MLQIFSEESQEIFQVQLHHAWAGEDAVDVQIGDVVKVINAPFDEENHLYHVGLDHVDLCSWFPRFDNQFSSSTSSVVGIRAEIFMTFLCGSARDQMNQSTCCTATPKICHCLGHCLALRPALDWRWVFVVHNKKGEVN